MKTKKKHKKKTNMFNPDQLCTIEQAREFVSRVNALGIGGGVSPEDASNDYHNDASGIYLAPWADIGNQPEPRIGEARPFLMHFNPTLKGFRAGGFNIGMSRAVARNHAPEGSPEADWNYYYALDSLKEEVNAQISAADDDR